MNKLLSAALCGALVLCCLAAPARAESKPEWVKNLGKTPDYPGARYIVGFGESAGGQERGERLESAKNAARADIAKQVQVNVESLTLQKEQYASGKEDVFLKTLSRSTANLRLDGIRVAETWCTKKGDRCCALAVLDKTEAARGLRAEIESLAREAGDLCGKARAEAGRDPGRAVEDYLAARGKLSLARRQTGVLLALGGTALGLQDGANTADIDQRIEALLGPGGKDLDLAVTRMAYELTRAVDPKLRILVDQFTLEPGKFSGSLAWFLSEGAQGRLVHPFGMNVVDNRRLTGKTAGAGSFGDLNPAAPEARARLVDADAVLYGTYRAAGDKVHVTAYLTDLTKGERLASARIEVDAAALKAKGLTLAPKNVSQELLEPPVAETPELQVRLWTDRGDGGVYREGERLYVYLKANRDCYVRLLYTQADGTNVQIFPNAYDRDNKIVKDKVYVVPNKDDPFEFEITAPFGAELLQAFASTEPLPALEGQPTDSGMTVLSGTRGSIVGATRGIKVKKRDALYTEARCVVSTLAGKP